LGIVLWAIFENYLYFIMFLLIGISSAAGEGLMIRFPKRRQLIRRTIHIMLGAFFLFGLMLYGNVNFQFSELFFDLYAGVVTGALIQLIIARVVMPFILGNGFCSRVCWDGAVFEIAQPMIPACNNPKPRKEWLAYGYMLLLIVMASVVSFIHNPAIFESSKIYWITAETFVILFIGIYLSRFWGSRTYCRTLCPFISISGLISRFSIFKITPVNATACNSCMKCNKSCPMLVDVMNSVQTNTRVFNKSCILCENCVDACPQNCLDLSADLPWK
jgi:polyferredoxin